MSPVTRLLRAFGYVKLKDYGYMLTPERRIVPIPSAWDLGSAGTGWQVEPLLPLEPQLVRPALGADPSAPLAKPPLPVLPARVITEPLPDAALHPVEIAAPVAAATANANASADAEEEEDDEEWEWRLAMARAAARLQLETQAAAPPAPTAPLALGTLTVPRADAMPEREPSVIVDPTATDVSAVAASADDDDDDDDDDDLTGAEAVPQRWMPGPGDEETTTGGSTWVSAPTAPAHDLASAIQSALPDAPPPALAVAATYAELMRAPSPIPADDEMTAEEEAAWEEAMLRARQFRTDEVPRPNLAAAPAPAAEERRPPTTPIARRAESARPTEEPRGVIAAISERARMVNPTAAPRPSIADRRPSATPGRGTRTTVTARTSTLTRKSVLPPVDRSADARARLARGTESRPSSSIQAPAAHDDPTKELLLPLNAGRPRAITQTGLGPVRAAEPTERSLRLTAPPSRPATEPGTPALPRLSDRLRRAPTNNG
jgi:hypothetical protein